MKKLNHISKIIYAIYIVFFMIVMFIAIASGTLWNILTFQLPLLSLSGLFSIPVIILYQIFLFFFVGKYCEERNLPGFVWLLICIVVPNYLGLVAFLLVVRYREFGNKLYRYLTIPSYHESEVTCQRCGDYVDPSFNGCPHCGQKTTKTCEYCGNQLKSDYHFCEICGEKVE